jgi:hypothetical protein
VLLAITCLLYLQLRTALNIFLLLEAVAVAGVLEAVAVAAAYLTVFLPLHRELDIAL